MGIEVEDAQAPVRALLGEPQIASPRGLVPAAEHPGQRSGQLGGAPQLGDLPREVGMPGLEVLTRDDGVPGIEHAQRGVDGEGAESRADRLGAGGGTLAAVVAAHPLIAREPEDHGIGGGRIGGGPTGPGGIGAGPVPRGGGRLGGFDDLPEAAMLVSRTVRAAGPRVRAIHALLLGVLRGPTQARRASACAAHLGDGVRPRSRTDWEVRAWSRASRAPRMGSISRSRGRAGPAPPVVPLRRPPDHPPDPARPEETP